MGEHNTLTGASLHEPKGAATATAGQTYVADGVGSGVWTTPASADLVTQVIVTQASDLASIDSTKEYFIDGIVDMGSQSIEVPAGGINLKGYNLGISKLISTAAGYTMFTSPVGGSGDVLGGDFTMDVSGASSQVFNLIGSTGFGAVEFARINYENCTSLGTLDNYRQGLEEGSGRFGGTPTLTLKGTWVGGFRITTSIVRSLDAGMTTPLFAAGAGFTMASRFLTDINCDLPASAAFCDFAPANFTNPSTVQFSGVIMSRDGVIDASDTNLTPNISESDLQCIWKNNIGLHNTHIGGDLEITGEAATVITVAGTYVDLAGTYTPTELVHFDEPANGQLRHLGNSPVEYTLAGNLVLDSTSADVVAVKVVIWRDASSSFEDGRIITRVINNLQGGRDVAYFTIRNNITLNQNDYVKIQVANIAATNNITAELSSFFVVGER